MPAYKNEFARPDHYEHEILSDGKKVGTLRVKPGGILWKPSGQHRFYSVNLERFADWITASATGATRTGS